LTNAGSAAGNRYEKRDLIAVGELLTAARMVAADDGQRGLEAGRDPGLEGAEPFEQILDRRTLR
jgi:hypothetical protein